MKRVLSTPRHKKSLHEGRDGKANLGAHTHALTLTHIHIHNTDPHTNAFKHSHAHTLLRHVPAHTCTTMHVFIFMHLTESAATQSRVSLACCPN